MTTTTETWHDKHVETLTRGERAADRLRNGMGSWPFVGIFLGIMGVWAALNTVGDQTWDPYPFILLNLFLSMLAGLQGAILLIAARRQDAIAAALAQHDYDTNLRAKEEIEELTEINRTQLDLLHEMRAHLLEVSTRQTTSNQPDDRVDPTR